MDVEKAGSKGLAFLNLFDWSKKSKKRLFANGDGSGGGSRSSSLGKAGDGKGANGSGPSSQSDLIVENDMVGVSSTKGSSDHSCSSSVIDEEGCARRGPSVVARLMGLDAMPTTSTSVSYSMPLTAPQSFRNNARDEWIGKSYVGSPHKMPGSPIDRFKMEVLPTRSAKRPFSVAQYKLLSPIKNSAYISGRNAADVMEAASRIITSGFENTDTYRVRHVGCTNPVHAYNPREIMKVPQKSSRLNEALKKREGPASPRLLGGKHSNRRMKNSESATSIRTSQPNGGDPAGPKVKGSATSTAPRGTNVQGREGASKNSRKVVTHKDHEHHIDDTSGSNHQSINNQRRTASSSNVLVQNNRKQNTAVVKHNVNSKLATFIQQRNSICSIGASPKKVRPASARTANSDGGNRKEEPQSSNQANRRLNSTTKAISKPRRLPDRRRMYSEKSQSSDKTVANRSQRRIQHNIVIDEQSSFSRVNKKVSTEIVSFTFTSSVEKSLPGSRFANQVLEPQFIEKAQQGSTSTHTSNSKPDVIDGDYLGHLLEQKLRELTYGFRSPYNKPVKGVRICASSSVLEDTTSVCETSSITSADCERESLKSSKDEQTDFSQTDIASQSGRSTESVECDSNITDQRESDHLHLSPLSILDASVSIETCSSSKSWKSTNGMRLFISMEGAKTSDSGHLGKVPEVDAVSEYSDTASSITVDTAEMPPSEISSSSRMDPCRQDLEFIGQILNAISLDGRIWPHCLERCANSDILDPILLEELNGNIRMVMCEEEGKDFRMRRRLLFDCVNEFLSLKCTYYFNAGYSSWFRGVAVLQKLSAEELYREMTSLKVAEEWMVDELVDKEMSSPLGKWVDFKIESYEAGGDMAGELLSTLAEEMVADLLTEAFV